MPQPRFTHITATNDTLYALDMDGTIWVYEDYNWIRLASRHALTTHTSSIEKSSTSHGTIDTSDSQKSYAEENEPIKARIYDRHSAT